ncbi:hypothetical protein DTO207G8_4890 [Paecilomyces variotii]|nr:hypothetical protein DTO207G8_4890 [Paecilomyces variotii]
MDTTEERFSGSVSYRYIDGWTNKFATNIHSLMAPSRCGEAHSHLHRVFRERAKEGAIYGELSRCDCDFMVPSQDWARTDSGMYQNHIRTHGNKEEAAKKMQHHGYLLRSLCHGVVFAAREKYPEDPQNVKHYALKVEPHMTQMEAIARGRGPTMACWDDVGGNIRYIPTEAMMMRFVTGSGRFPVIESVYTHDLYQTTVMSAAAVDYDPRRETRTSDDEEDYFPSFLGAQLIEGKTPLLREVEVCKVAWQMLQAMMYLMDMNMSHDDLSHHNYVVDEYLNIQILDFGLMIFALDGEHDFQVTRWAWLPYQEYQISPELAIELSKEMWKEGQYDVEEERIVYLPHDARVEHLWKFGCIVYDLLHGYSAWEDRKLDHRIGGIRQWAQKRAESNEESWWRMLERRDRVINEELPIDENLSQDCVDVLRAMFTKDPEKRPTLHGLASFPWFQGHWMNEGAFRRPAADFPEDSESTSEDSGQTVEMSGSWE